MGLGWKGPLRIAPPAMRLYTENAEYKAALQLILFYSLSVNY